jgi:amino acid transporter
MRVAAVLLVLLAFGAGMFGGVTPATQLVAADASFLQQQPEAQPQPTTPPAQQDDAEITSAGWANILWIVIVLVLAVAFVWLAMVGLRSRTRE